MTSVHQEIETSLINEFAPLFIEVVDESHLHAGHAAAPAGGSSHFRVTLVSEKFEGQTPIKQHRMVNAVLKPFMDAGVHAMALKTIKPSRWQG